MKYFLISNMEFLGHQPEKNKVKRFVHKKDEFWSTALDDIDMFVVNTYDCDAYIIFVKPEELYLATLFIHSMCGLRHVIIKSKLNAAFLKELETDINLNVNVYFIH